ncbi:benzoate/H(+) symporter BenE family transporter [Glutamicibacter soli]|uniref:Benzoate/H(+) symporter BenE family transporter n=1 Tax=Glutamicibacter soli TaxID=453836 RepID=A0A6L9G0F4_9MICC|nr:MULTISPECIES: benzoate/H(+) symporter BenE family transporter [Micrococcaceae]NAZ14674.1 benzoate/H(+) symporter BenE family transporter [Glutamicibacter soli]RKS22614.1 benzoate membrane transport protein [Arthrobacter sp. AG1021]
MESNIISRPRLPREAVLAGFITTMVGFTSSFAVVITGLLQAGASPSQASSGLLALTFLVGVASLVLSLKHRLPITVAWSTPGAALLASLAAGSFSFAESVGAFIISGVLIMLTGLIPVLHRLLTSIPVPIAQGMLAGVLIPLCLKPFTALGSIPVAAVLILAVFLAGLRFLPRYAVALSMLGAVGCGLFSIGASHSWAQIEVLPTLEFVAPEFSWQAVASISLPLFIVTMASQNIPGVAVMSSFGFRTPWRSSMLSTGFGSAAGAFFGGHAINLAAISAALSAGESGGKDPGQRWKASASSGVFYLVFALGSALVASLATLSPAGLFEAAAGLALLATLANAMLGAMKEPRWQLSALATMLVAAANVTLFGIGGAFWALVIGLLIHVIAEQVTARR